MLRTLLYATALAAIIALTGCSGGAGKFVGKWREVDRGERAKVLVIEKKGAKYDLYPEERPDRFMPMEYDKDHDILTAHEGNMTLDVMYNADTKRIRMGSRGDNDTKEFEKVN